MKKYYLYIYLSSNFMTAYNNRDRYKDKTKQDFVMDDNILPTFTEEESKLFNNLVSDENTDNFNNTNSSCTLNSIEIYLQSMVDILFKSAINLNQDINLQSKYIHKDTYDLCKIVYNREFRKIDNDTEETRYNDMFKKICTNTLNTL